MIDALKTFAKDHHIPIISDDGLLFILDAIKKYDVKDVLEIGTAIGYSAIAMALFGVKVDTIERQPDMQALAKTHIKSFGLDDKIQLICADAIDYEMSDQTYDLIFIDAAKAQYQRFFEKYSPYLKKDGIIICDNLHFHHLNPQKVNRNTRQLLGKIESFKTFVANHPDFDTKFHDIGDGMSLSKRSTHETDCNTI
ncbi:MAG: O-methyltransferase [Acholeplasmataceae bacterium]